LLIKVSWDTGGMDVYDVQVLLVTRRPRAVTLAVLRRSVEKIVRDGGFGGDGVLDRCASDKQRVGGGTNRLVRVT
jgi:hypothetical protein